MVGKREWTHSLFSTYFILKGCNYLMVEITKSEAKAVHKIYPHACIAKTRHKRYLEESVRYLVLLPFNVEACKLVEQAQRNARY